MAFVYQAGKKKKKKRTTRFQIQPGLDVSNKTLGVYKRNALIITSEMCGLRKMVLCCLLVALFIIISY